MAFKYYVICRLEMAVVKGKGRNVVPGFLQVGDMSDALQYIDLDIKSRGAVADYPAGFPLEKMDDNTWVLTESGNKPVSNTYYVKREEDKDDE